MIYKEYTSEYYLQPIFHVSYFNRDSTQAEIRWKMERNHKMTIYLKTGTPIIREVYLQRIHKNILVRRFIDTKSLNTETLDTETQLTTQLSVLHVFYFLKTG